MLSAAISGAFQEVNSGNRREPVEIIHRENKRTLDEAMNHYFVALRINFGDSIMMDFIMQR